MEKVVYNLSFDLLLEGPQHSIRCHSGEGEMRVIEASFTSGDSAFSLKKIKEAKIRAEEKGKFLYDDCEIEDNKVLYTFKSDFLKTEGIKVCQFTLYDEKGSLLAAPCFNIEVLPLIYNDNELMAQSDYSALITAKTKAENAAALAESMVSEVFSAKNGMTEILLKTQEAAKKAEDVREEMKSDLDDYIISARKALSNPPVLVSAGEITEDTADIRINLGSKVYGDISIYLTIPPSGKNQNWGFYTYFDDFWTLHTDHNSGNSQGSGILPALYSFVRINSRYDGGHWVSESGNFWSNSATAGWSANVSLITRGKSKGEDRPFIESVRFVSDYMPSYSQGNSQIPFPKGTRWEIYGRRDPDIFSFEVEDNKVVSHIGSFELLSSADSLIIDADKIKNSTLALKGRILAYIEIPPAGATFGFNILANDKTLAKITTGADDEKTVAINLEAEHNGADFSVKWMRATDSLVVPWSRSETVSGMVRTDFYGDENPIIKKLELKCYSNTSALLPRGTKINLYATRI